MRLAINKPETDLLFQTKVNEGKTFKEANEEINKDKDFQKDIQVKFKIQSNIKKQLEFANKKILELENKLRAKQKERFIAKLHEITDGDTGELATTKDLTRIETLIQSEGKAGLSDLSKTCCLNPKRTKNALSYLIKDGKVKEGYEHGAMTFEWIQ
jgi:hypothetical protein